MTYTDLDTEAGGFFGHGNSQPHESPVEYILSHTQ